ncbi:tRNA threonylcarbamoyladenosine biosynthesis protein TsaE [Ruminococcaceae bacterium YRB3002]|nr:tRNA threonylcarbamoyladenosine biosynthesis protein TsaE [Ruminococcaceae bacterium YRB3002]
MTAVFNTTSSDQTEEFASRFAALLKAGDIITLDGDLGAGKTCFARGVARGMGSPSHVSSPTFTIVNEYEGGRLPVYHFDTYRLGGCEDFVMAGLDEYLWKDGVCLIEWSDIIGDIIPGSAVRIRIEGTGDVRRFVIECPGGEMYNSLTRIIEEMGL